MKKTIVLAIMAVMGITTVSAQSAAELAKQQRELNAINTKLLNAKPTKDAKKQARVYTKLGWMVPAGEKTIEKQFTESQLLGEELMADEMGNPTKRYIQNTAEQVGGTYVAAFDAARYAASNQLAASIKQQLMAVMQSKVDNSQSSAITAVTVDKFNQRSKAIVDETLTNVRTVVALYRILPNNNYNVMVRLAFDKKELSARLKRKMQQELEQEGDELNGLVDEVLGKHI